MTKGEVLDALAVLYSNVAVILDDTMRAKYHAALKTIYAAVSSNEVHERDRQAAYKDGYADGKASAQVMELRSVSICPACGWRG